MFCYAFDSLVMDGVQANVIHCVCASVNFIHMHVHNVFQAECPTLDIDIFDIHIDYRYCCYCFACSQNI